MITVGAKVYFGLAAFALVAAAVLGLASGGSPVGVLSFGWSGAVGDQLGYVVLVSTAATSITYGVVTTAFRDAEAEAVAQVAGTEALPAARPHTDLSLWPVVTAFGVVAVVIGLVVEPLLTGVGIALLVIAAVEWTATAWADRATGDPAANRAIRNRVMQPVEIPAVAIIGIATFVFFASRMLLALSKWGSIAVFSVTAILIMGVAALIASRPAVSRGVITAVLLLGGVSLVVGGIVGIGAGERDFHYVGGHGEDVEDHGGADDALDEDDAQDEGESSVDTDEDQSDDSDADTDAGDTEE
ncbi:hypothetical protein [Actinomarinicola tropica]|uniref:Uncharacterized protein n=1 Tax=Actinomarinicola tropica TaxID=2789776 RepID=A0A5Q2RRF5_9ACTN|nr:hypothetical protein [Actinomarinicola tropica]QGG96727.1 hypothetical protein GH723_17390 [Actinomarinicola tropica]